LSHGKILVTALGLFWKRMTEKNRTHTVPPLIEVENCSIVLDGKKVLDEASFELRCGERWLLSGPNGSGKTLLLKLLRGDMWPTPTGRERRRYAFDGAVGPGDAKERIAYVGPERQDRYVRYDWNHTVDAVVATGIFDEDIPRTRPAVRQHRQVARLLRQFGLWSLRRRGFLTLSYGQRRRALIARAFAGSPQVLLLDEVFNGLDKTSAAILRRALRRTRGVGSTWIVTTHRAHDMPGGATHFATIRNGKVAPTKRSDAALKSSRSSAKSSLKSSSARRKSLRSPRVASRSASTPLLIELRNVDLYRDYRQVLRDVNWTINRGEHWAIAGRNGSGKSTLLKLLYGDLHPRLGGEIERAGVPAGTPIAEWKARVGFVSPELQADYFLARDLEEVAISGRYSSIGLNDEATKKDRADAKRWLRFFKTADLAYRKPRAVSYGQMRLALFARAMMNDPEVLLLDEPVTGLDVDMRALVLDLLDRLASRGVQLIMAVHDLSDLPECVGKVLRIRKDRRVEVVMRDA
jgi:molybdate transport system ATP-binding protein